MKIIVRTAVGGALAAALLAGSALAQEAASSKSRVGRDLGDAASAPVGMASAATLGSVDTRAFVENAARSDMYEIAAAKLAEERSQDARVKAFAREMIRDHTKTSEALKAHLPAGVAPPAELDKRRQGMVDDLANSRGAEFDKRYINQQVAAHEEALTLMKGYAAHGRDPALRRVAAEAVPIITRHLEMARGLARTH